MGSQRVRRDWATELTDLHCSFRHNVLPLLIGYRIVQTYRNLYAQKNPNLVWVTVLWCSLYCHGLELNQQCLQGMPDPILTKGKGRKIWGVSMDVGKALWELDPSADFPGGASDKDSTCQCSQCKRLGFDPWVGKIPKRRKWQPTPAFLPGKFHGQRSLVVHRVWKSWMHSWAQVTQHNKRHCRRANLHVWAKQVSMSTLSENRLTHLVHKHTMSKGLKVNFTLYYHIYFL